jgi:hypothetical protein
MALRENRSPAFERLAPRAGREGSAATMGAASGLK